MKKGFTLIELLGVIAILALLFGIAVPTVIHVVNEYRTNLYETQLNNIESGARNWGTDHIEQLPAIDGDKKTVTLGELKLGGYVDKKIKDPRNKKYFRDQMLITITYEDNDYLYEVERIEGTEDENSILNPNMPTIILNGESKIFVEVNTVFVDPGVSAMKHNLSQIPNESIVINIAKDGSSVTNIDTTRLGTYTITYEARDGEYKASIERTVVVRDTIPPILTIPEDIRIASDVFTIDLMSGVSASDNSNESMKVITSGELSLGVPGIYKISYVVSDSSGHKTEKIRTITIFDSRENSEV